MTQPSNLYASAYVTITCDDPPTELRVLLGADRPDVSAGYGGWNEVERPKRMTVTTWRGQPARRMALAVLFDNFEAGESIETDLRRLERLALPRPGGQPPAIAVSAPGGVIPPAYEAMAWVIDGLDWGDALMNAYGNRTRQAVTLTLLQFVADDLVQVLSPAKKRRAKSNRKTGKTTKKGAKKKRVASKAGGTKRTARSASVVYDGEDLLSVAARELGDANRWHEIAALNGIRDPRAITRSQVIRLP